MILQHCLEVKDFLSFSITNQGVEMLGRSTVRMNVHSERVHPDVGRGRYVLNESPIVEHKRQSSSTVNLRKGRKRNELVNFSPDMHSTPKSSDLKLEEVGPLHSKSTLDMSNEQKGRRSPNSNYQKGYRTHRDIPEMERYEKLLQDEEPRSYDWNKPKKLADAFRDSKSTADYLQITEDIRTLSSRPSASPVPTPPNGSPKHSANSKEVYVDNKESPSSSQDEQFGPRDEIAMPDPWSDLMTFNAPQRAQSFKSCSWKGSVTSEKSSRLDPHTYQCYTAGLLHSTGRSEKFLNLQKHFAVLERISEIEQQSENVGGKRPLSYHAKGCETEELQDLYFELQEAKKNKEFYSKKPDQVSKQWNPNADKGLIRKEKSLHDLKNVFNNDGSDSLDNSYSRRSRSRGEKFSQLAERFRSFDDTHGYYEPVGSPAEGNRTRSKSEPRKINNEQRSWSENQGHGQRVIPLHGTHIEDSKNKYEVYVKEKRKQFKSENESDNGLHVRSLSAPYSKDDDPKPLTRTNSSKDSHFREPSFENRFVHPTISQSSEMKPPYMAEVHHGRKVTSTYVNENPELRKEFEEFTHRAQKYSSKVDFVPHHSASAKVRAPHIASTKTSVSNTINPLSASVNDNELFSNKARKENVRFEAPNTLSWNPPKKDVSRASTPQFEVRNLRNLAKNNEFAQGKFAQRQPLLDKYLQDVQLHGGKKGEVGSEDVTRPFVWSGERSVSTSALYSPSQSLRSDYGHLRRWGEEMPRCDSHQESWENSSCNDTESTLSDGSAGTFIIKHSDDESVEEADVNLPDVTKGTTVRQNSDHLSQGAPERSRSVPNLKEKHVIEDQEPVRPRPAKSQVKLNEEEMEKKRARFLPMPRTHSGNLREELRQKKADSKFARSRNAKQQQQKEIDSKLQDKQGGSTESVGFPDKQKEGTRMVGFHYDAYMPPRDILKEVTKQHADKYKRDEPLKKFRSPSYVGQMTVDYLDTIGSEWSKENYRDSIHKSKTSDITSSDSNQLPSSNKNAQGDDDGRMASDRIRSENQKNYLQSCISLQEKSKTLPGRYYHSVAVPKIKPHGEGQRSRPNESSTLPRVTRSVRRGTDMPHAHQKASDTGFFHVLCNLCSLM